VLREAGLGSSVIQISYSESDELLIAGVVIAKFQGQQLAGDDPFGVVYSGIVLERLNHKTVVVLL